MSGRMEPGALEPLLVSGLWTAWTEAEYTRNKIGASLEGVERTGALYALAALLGEFLGIGTEAVLRCCRETGMGAYAELGHALAAQETRGHGW